MKLTMLTQSEIDAIKQEASKWALDNPDETMGTNSALNRGYIAGATEQRQRAKVLCDALEEIIKSWDNRGLEKEELKENTTAVVVQDKKISSGFIYLKSERKMTKVMLDDILYIESAGDYLKVYTQNSSLVTRQTISSIEAILSGDEFIRVHRSYIVSIKKISSFTHETVEIGKIELPIGKFYLNSFLKLQGS